jgi:hypothetical protein
MIWTFEATAVWSGELHWKKPFRLSAFRDKVDEPIERRGLPPTESFPSVMVLQGLATLPAKGWGTPREIGGVKVCCLDDALKATSVIAATRHESAEPGHLLKTAC